MTPFADAKRAARQQGEWDPHAAVWTAWPSHPEYWEGWIQLARSNVTQFLRALASPTADGRSGEVVHLWVDSGQAEQSARAALAGVDITFHVQPFGDIWFRDIGPIFVREAEGALTWRAFGNNGWGGKFVMAGDESVGRRIGEMTGLAGVQVPMIFEGGALDVDGEGIGLTTRSCLLNPNRNPQLAQQAIETCLREQLGVEELVWLGDGLANDHTDGHIDNIARFVAPRTVVCQTASGSDDPNAEVLKAIEQELRSWRGAGGETLRVETIPSPGRHADDDGKPLPASHMNFYIANHKVLVPVYGTPSEEAALAGMQRLFPAREVVGVNACGLLRGGGAFHCMTQQQPL